MLQFTYTHRVSNVKSDVFRIESLFLKCLKSCLSCFFLKGAEEHISIKLLTEVSDYFKSDPAVTSCYDGYSSILHSCDQTQDEEYQILRVCFLAINRLY